MGRRPFRAAGPEPPQHRWPFGVIQASSAGRPIGIGKKIAHRAEAVKGSAVKTVGRLTGNRRLQARGRRVQAKGNIKQHGTKIKDALKR